MPGTPTSVTSCSPSRCGRAVERAVEQLAPRALARRARRTAVLRACRRRRRARARPPPRRARVADFPLAVDRVRLPGTRSRRSVARCVASPTSTPLTGRGRLQPRGGVDDVAGHERLAFGRMRVERDERLAGVDRRRESRARRRPSASRTASAARTARSGSSSCATGAPKTAITASPMNFSTVPPKRSSSIRACVRGTAPACARTSSGIEPLSARAVKPTRSANRHGHDLALLARRTSSRLERRRRRTRRSARRLGSPGRRMGR